MASPPGSSGTTILLTRASKQEQLKYIGNQTGGRVFLSLGIDDFWKDYHEMVEKHIIFVREPKEQSYGAVAVFKGLYGNLQDLVQFKENHPVSQWVKEQKQSSLC